ncbi:hypothetical protein FSC37_13560 [Piscinibacter aquaticus]|uniref:Uncharacterized protein n=1 Tax=Piscinibacter aquaticus TaxID=392597 RepID=A0A5C6U0D6_9BURK|nr:hypothetical protein FSC37_13560 [Piscinibacter aquaticus]
MTDLSAPWNGTCPRAGGPAAAPRREPDKVAREAFGWPTPPFASYPAPTPQTDPMPCEIVGLNDKHTTGRLTFFVPEEAVAHVQIPPARTTLPLRFDQFRALTLTTPLAPQALAPGEPHPELLGQRSESDFRITWSSGGELAGRSIGHVETEHGLFLFPPIDAAGSVRRMFVPRAAYASFEVGPKIGELLVMNKHATAQQVEQAVDAQKNLRSQKLGDILLMRRWCRPSSCSRPSTARPGCRWCASAMR